MVLWAGVESLLGVESELSYRLRLYISMLLEKAQTSREVLFASVKKAYDVRSKVVHGIGASSHEIDSQVVFMRDKLSRLITNSMDNGSIWDAKNIDALILGQTESE